MKLNQSNKKMGKRTFTLKELAQRDFTTTQQVPTENIAPVFSLVNIQEDLLEDNGNRSDPSKESFVSNNEPLINRKANALESLTLPIELLNHLIKKEISKTSKALDLEEVELQAWIDLQVMAPKQTLLSLLRIAKENHLDPLKEEVSLALYDDCHWQAYITVEGYSRILNNHPAFDGIHFTQSLESTNGIPIWMECTIYRKDRSHPFIVREYFEEVKGEQAIWKKMPRRMLRHRVMQQCAKLSIG
jgi:hypothetical protein